PTVRPDLGNASGGSRILERLAHFMTTRRRLHTGGFFNGRGEGLMTAPRALTIAGSDSGGGAGIQADLKTFQELGVFGMSALTAVTAQNTLGVTGIYELEAEAVTRQLDAVTEDIGIDALKTGMIGTVAIMETIAEKVEQNHLG